MVVVSLAATRHLRWVSPAPPMITRVVDVRLGPCWSGRRPRPSRRRRPSPPPAPPTAISSMSSDCVGVDARGRCRRSRMSARPGGSPRPRCRCGRGRPQQTPTPASLPNATLPDDSSSLSAVSLARTSTLPPAWTVASSSMYAVVPCESDAVEQHDQDRAGDTGAGRRAARRRRGRRSPRSSPR